MEHLRCKTPEMAIRELWVYLLAYNLIRMLMAQAALLVDKIPRQLSFKHTVQVCIAWPEFSWQQRGGLKMTKILQAVIFTGITISDECSP